MSERSDLGNILQTSRESLGWTIEDVSHRTRIPCSTLLQLEENDYSRFASKAYAKSFLSQYCDYLDLDAIDLVDQFETEDVLSATHKHQYLRDHDEHIHAKPLVIKRPKRRRVKVKKTQKAGKSRPAPTEKKPPSSPTRHSQQPLLVFSITVLLIAGALVGFMKLSDSFGGEETAGRQEPAEVLGSIDGVITQVPSGPDLSDVPRALPVTPDNEGNLVANPSGTEGLGPTPSTQGSAPPTFSLENPPPRAVVVEE